MPATVPEIIKMFYNCAGERQTFPCRILTPINAGLPHLARVCRYRARVHRLPACCCRLVAWHGAELERDGIRKASLYYGRQTDAMGRQTDAMGRQTDAMGRQTDTMGRQTCAEGRNRATWCAMGRHTDAMGRHTDAMGRH